MGQELHDMRLHVNMRKAWHSRRKSRDQVPQFWRLAAGAVVRSTPQTRPGTCAMMPRRRRPLRSNGLPATGACRTSRLPNSITHSLQAAGRLLPRRTPAGGIDQLSHWSAGKSGTATVTCVHNALPAIVSLLVRRLQTLAVDRERCSAVVLHPCAMQSERTWGP